MGGRDISSQRASIEAGAIETDEPLTRPMVRRSVGGSLTARCQEGRIGGVATDGGCRGVPSTHTSPRRSTLDGFHDKDIEVAMSRCAIHGLNPTQGRATP